MLKLIEGGFFSDREERIKRAILELVEKGQRVYLIVPEQQTLTAEREMTDFLPPFAPLYFEATNFTRLADTVLRSIGGISGDCANAPARALIMWRTLTELSPFLDMTADSEVNQATVERALSAVAQLQSLGIDSERINATISDLNTLMPEGADRLKAKLSDVSMITSLYNKLLKEQFSGTTDTVSMLAERISPKVKILSDATVFIDGFTSFTEPQYSVIEKLSAFTDVTVSLVLPKFLSDAFEFTETRRAHERLLREASLAGTDAALIRANENSISRPLIKELSYSLFHSNSKIDAQLCAPSCVSVLESANPYDECDFLVSDIKRRVMAGAKYSDFAIISRSIASYSGIIDTAFEKAGIPLFLSKRKDISATEGVKLIYTAISAVLGGFSATDVISYSKCSLSGVPRALTDEFELYVNTWQINGKRFTDGEAWNMNPRGYSISRPKGTDEKLLRIDSARRAIIEPLTALEESFSECETVTDYAGALLTFLVGLSTEEKLKTKADELARLGLTEESLDTERLWQTICNALDTLVKTLPDVKINLRTFFALLKTVFSYADIGRIPAYTEEVTAASADIGRIENKKFVYIIGVNFGVFPLGVFDDEYFSERDGEILVKLGLPELCERRVRAARELYYVIRSISLAKEHLTLTYNSANESFASILPSDVITRISELTQGKITPVKLSSLPPEDRIYTPDFAAEHIYGKRVGTAVRAALERVGYGDRVRMQDALIRNENARLGKDILSDLYRGPLALTQSRIDKFVSCPMSYYCTYDLKLSPERRAEFVASDIGNFVHALLEYFFITLKARGRRISEITDGEKRDIIKRSAEEYIGKLFEGGPAGSARMKVDIERLCRAAAPVIDSLCEEFGDCKYEPVFFELDINRENESSPEPAAFRTSDEREVYIYGTIDRVDRYISEGGDVYVKVTDYKTGTKEFSPSDLEEGRNLQMFLYLKSITETDKEGFRERLGATGGGRIIPAGVIYMKADIGEGKLDKNDADLSMASALKRQKRLGMLLDDDESLAAMNPKTLPIKVTKKNGIQKDASKFYSLEGWERINETLSKVVGNIADQMLAGEISATPLKKGGKSSACSWCEFKSFCRNPKL